jgi:hypothetical protein
VNEEGGGANAAATGRILASTGASRRSLDKLDEMVEGIGKACILRNSFSLDTRVLLADGTTKPISESSGQAKASTTAIVPSGPPGRPD